MENTMPKKQTKPKYPKEIHVVTSNDGLSFFIANEDDDTLYEGEVAIYQFVRMAKVKRTVTVE